MLGRNKVVARTSISFASGDNKTIEKQVSITAQSIFDTYGEKPDGEVYILNIDKTASDTAGDLTLYLYRKTKVDGTNARNCLFQPNVIEKTTGASTYRSIPVYYPFAGTEEELVIGAVFGTNSSETITVHLSLIKP